MKIASNGPITVETTVNAPLAKVWQYWTEPRHITQWNQASDDWHTPSAENDVRVGGKFKSTMAARDGSTQFDFEGVYINVKVNERIEYSLADGRHVSIEFESHGPNTKVVESFDPETVNSPELQRQGWQAILNSFRKYTESN
ncbi:MAG: SRPBCC family protein [Cytophagales bacterium]|nr:SRPBCC family protein [Cytophagales bacterium]